MSGQKACVKRARREGSHIVYVHVITEGTHNTGSLVLSVAPIKFVKAPCFKFWTAWGLSSSWYAPFIISGFKYILCLAFCIVIPALSCRLFMPTNILRPIQQTDILLRLMARPGGRVCSPHSSPVRSAEEGLWNATLGESCSTKITKGGA